MKYITIILLLFIMACENQTKKEVPLTDSKVSARDMDVYIDEGSLITLGDTSEIWVKRKYPDGQTDQVTSIDSKGNKNIYEYDGIASLNLFDCKQGIYIIDEIYYFLGDKPVTEIENRPERLEDKSKWSKIETGTYIDKIYHFACKPPSE